MGPPNLVLIHGAWHGGWCWERIEKLLTLQNINTYVLDLPVLENEKSHNKVTLETYVDFVKSYLLGLNEKAILIGHSMAGIVLSQVANDLPDYVDKLIYLAAFAPGSGSSLMEQAKTFEGVGVSTEMIFNDDYTSIALRKNSELKRIFYNQCSDKDVEMIYSKLRAEPAIPFSDKLHLGNPELKGISKHYIVCEDDNAITCSDQVKIAQMNNCQIYSIDADHSPFFSQPKELSNIISRIVKE